MDLTLRKYDSETDLPQLYDLFISQENICSYMQFPIFNNEECWRKWVRKQVMGYFKELYLFTDSLNICGFVVAYDYRSNDRHCKVHFALKKGLRTEVVIPFLSLLFREYSLNKIFVEVINKETELLRDLLKLGFKKEAEFQNYVFLKGEHHNLVTLGIYSSIFYSE